MDFDIEFREGRGRPENLEAHELIFIFPNPEDEFLIRTPKELKQVTM